MATSVTITKVITESAPSKRILVNFSDGSQKEFGAVDGSVNAVADIQQRLADMNSDVEYTKMLAIAIWAAKDANLSNTNLALKTVTYDLAAASPIKVA